MNIDLANRVTKSIPALTPWYVDIAQRPELWTLCELLLNTASFAMQLPESKRNEAASFGNYLCGLLAAALQQDCLN